MQVPKGIPHVAPRQLPPANQLPSPIDPEKMDETLRLPFCQELNPFSGRRLGDLEWIAFEEMLQRWSSAIKEVVTAQRCRPPPQSHFSMGTPKKEARATNPLTIPRPGITTLPFPAGGGGEPSQHQGLEPGQASGQGMLPTEAVPS